MNEQLQNIYDGFADTYDENRGLFDMTEVFNSFYSGLDSDGGCLLDLGCGAGEPLARFFLNQGWQVTGVDFSKRMLELARRYAPEMEQVTGDMREVQFDPASFDAVAAVYSLFHVPKGDHRQVLANVLSWLKPGGRLLFTYATKRSIQGKRNLMAIWNSWGNSSITVIPGRKNCGRCWKRSVLLSFLLTTEISVERRFSG